jgi:hypothetical protein
MLVETKGNISGSQKINQTFIFSQTRRKAAYLYIKERKEKGGALQKQPPCLT